MKNATLISILLDRSGSMGSIVNDVIGGYNNFLNEQKAAKGECHLTLTQFDTGSIDVLYEYADITDIPELTTKTYEPRGGTPLLDALGQTIEATGRALENISESERPDKILFVVITDGEENSSRTFTKARVKEMIEHQEKVYGWNFVFLGANQDAFAEAGSIGIAMTNSANYTPDSAGMAAGFAAMSANSVSYRGSGQSADLHFSSAQRSAMYGKKDTLVPPTSTATQPPVRSKSQARRLDWQRRGKK